MLASATLIRIVPITSTTMIIIVFFMILAIRPTIECPMETELRSESLDTVIFTCLRNEYKFLVSYISFQNEWHQ